MKDMINEGGSTHWVRDFEWGSFGQCEAGL